jgi:transposase
MMERVDAPHPGVEMSFNFLPYDQSQLLLMPPALQEWVGTGSLARFVSEVVDELDERGDLESFYAQYRTDGWGRPAYPPRMMIKVVLYGCSVGVRSSRKLGQALEQDVAFRYLAANLRPDFRTLAGFRTQHAEALDGLFVHVLQLCREAGLVKLGHVALDGRRVAGNAALERNRTKAELLEIVRQIRKESEAIDAAEDRLYGEDKRGDELPEALQTREGRLKAIRAALDQLKKPEEEIRAAHENKVEARKQQEKKTGKRARGRKPKLKEDKIRRMRANMTDPESRMMKTRKGFVQGYNGQIMVDCSSQVIVAQDLRQEAVDWTLLKPMLKRCEVQAGARPKVCIMDGGYWSEANAALGDRKTRLYIAVGSSAEFEGRPDNRIRKNSLRGGPQAVKMRKKLSAEEGRKIYKQRSSTVEPVFGQMYERGLNRYLLRGVEKVRAEWSLWCTSHNLLKLWRAVMAPQPI